MLAALIFLLARNQPLCHGGLGDEEPHEQSPESAGRRGDEQSAPQAGCRARVATGEISRSRSSVNGPSSRSGSD